MEALLINVHSDRNAGDAALTATALQQLKRNFPGIRVTLAMDDPQSFNGDGQPVASLFTWVRKTDAQGNARWKPLNLLILLPATLLPLLASRLAGEGVLRLAPPRLRPLIYAYHRADLVASAAGGFLYSSGLGLTLLLSLYTMVLAMVAGKPLYLFPQSFGPFVYGWERHAVRLVLQYARLIFVREAVSLEELQKCGLPTKRLHLIPDIAVAYPAAPPDQARAWLLQKGIDAHADRPLLGVTMINWGAQDPRFTQQEAYEDAVCAAVRCFLETNGGTVLLLPQVTGPYPAQDDRVPARRIAPQLQNRGGKVVVVEEALPPALLKAVYGQMDLFIGTRMHSNIFAVGMGVPVIAIGYQHKTRGIAHTLGIEDWVLDIRTVNAQKLQEVLNALWEQRFEVRKELQETLPGIIGEANAPGELIAADFRALKSRSRSNPRNGRENPHP